MSIDAAKDAYLGIFWAALRAAGVFSGPQIDESVGVLRAQLDRTSPVDVLELSPVYDHLLRVGMTSTQAAEVVLYAAKNSADLDFEVRLPEPLERMPAVVRKQMVQDFALRFAREIVMFQQATSGESPLDHTPIIDLKRLTHGDPTKLTPVLIVIQGREIGRVHRIGRGRMVLGRVPESDLQIDDEGVSRRHAEIINDGQIQTIVDLGSKNGVVVNGFGIGEHVLEEGDRIQIGSSTMLKFALQDEFEQKFQDELYQYITYDVLTGVYNRRFFLERLRAECAFVRRHGGPLSLLMLDVDHFKALNDTHGHPAGDLVLADLGKILKAALRTEDMCGRYGGEEFCMLLRGTSEPNAQVVAERIRSRVEQHPFLYEGTRLNVTVSIGVATASPDANDTVTELIAAADQNLYRAKEGGRNRVVPPSP